MTKEKTVYYGICEYCNDKTDDYDKIKLAMEDLKHHKKHCYCNPKNSQCNSCINYKPFIDKNGTKYPISEYIGVCDIHGCAINIFGTKGCNDHVAKKRLLRVMELLKAQEEE